jgi:MFS transporter, PAT family, beta-lactamase induction signal transducer AmpG
MKATFQTLWREQFAIYRDPATLRMLFLGFSAGTPILLVFGTLSFWLREAGIDRKTIGFISWVALAYAFKWAWAPLVDHLRIPLLGRLGRRRSWLLLSQIVVALALLSMATTDPKGNLYLLVICALVVAFASATQDIALDAFRIEISTPETQAMTAAAYQAGYRVGMIWAGAGALWLAAYAAPTERGYYFSAWTFAYVAMAASMLVGMIVVLFSREPERRDGAQNIAFEEARAQLETRLPPALRGSASSLAWVWSAGVMPFLDFLKRYGPDALLILALISVYRISDVVMGVMANAFYVDMGYTKAEVANISKVYGVIMTIIGGFVGGSLALGLGKMRVLMIGAILSAASNLLYSWLAGRGHDVSALIWVISMDNLAQGIAGAAFIAYLSSLTNIQYTATQYALFSSLMLLFPKWLAGYSGQFVNAYGYVNFFNATALIGAPVLILVWLAAKREKARQT